MTKDEAVRVMTRVLGQVMPQGVGVVVREESQDVHFGFCFYFAGERCKTHVHLLAGEWLQWDFETALNCCKRRVEEEVVSYVRADLDDMLDFEAEFGEAVKKAHEPAE